MASFNKVILLGNLTRDPQLKYLPSQMAVVEFSLACNRKFRTAAGEDREEVAFIDCTAFGRGAEVINQYCQKGRPLFVEGRLKYDTWEDKQGGGKRSKLSVVVDNFQLLGGPGGPGGPGGGGGGGQNDEGGAPQQGAPRGQYRQQQPRGGGGGGGGGRPQQQPQDPPFGDETSFKEDDIPF